MKQLICLKDVEAAKQSGKAIMTVEENAIITPAAQDTAKSCGIQFLRSVTAPTCDVSVVSEKPDNEINADLVYALLKVLEGKGLLNGIYESLQERKAYEAEKTQSGLKIVRGNTVKYSPFDTGNPSDKVFYREFIDKEDGSTMNGGFITFEDSRFDWECTCQKMCHIVEGALEVFVDGKTYIVRQGDTIFLPKGAKVVLRSEKKTKAFYATC
jgi:Ethanolamine utilization protein